MGFLIQAFAFGTATFAIPVVIHLLFKLRKRRVVFSTLRFLQVAVLKETRRLRLRDLILLLLRAAACIFIALAFARPYLESQIEAGGSGKPAEYVVVVLDDSPSMSAVDGISTRWDQALHKAEQYWKDRGSDDRIALILSSEPAQAKIEFSSSQRVADEVAQLKPAAKRGSMGVALHTAVDLLADAPGNLRRIVILSDFQANQIDRAEWAREEQRAVRLTPPVKIDLEPPGEAAPKRLNNVAITSVFPRKDVWIEGVPVVLAVRVENFGDGDVPNLPLRIVSGGKILGETKVGIGPKSAAEVELAVTIAKPGEVYGEAEIAPKDALPEDDKFYFAFKLRNGVRILEIEDELQSGAPETDEGYYVRMSLGLTTRNEPENSFFQLTPVAVKELFPTTFKDADLIVMTGVTELPTPALAALEQAVKSGKNLVLFVGRSTGSINEGFYNGPLWKEGEGLLPARPGALFEGNQKESKVDNLDWFKAGSPLFKPFEDGKLEAELRKPEFLQHYRPDPADLKKGSRPAGEVLAKFQDGAPLLLERPYGKGRVVMFTFAPRPERGTNLVVRHGGIFIPWMHQLVKSLAGAAQDASRQLLTGGELDFSSINQVGGVLKIQPTPPQPLELRSNVETITIDNRGIYEVSGRKDGLPDKAYWAANLDPQESDLTPEDLTALRGLYSSNPEEHAGAAGPMQLSKEAKDELKRASPMWLYFMVAAAVCLLLEVMVRDFWER